MNRRNNYITPQELLPTGEVPPKAPKRYEDCFYDRNKSDVDIRVDYTFELSGDFLLGNTNAGEIDFYAVYDPLSGEEYADYGSGLINPYFCLCSAAENEVYEIMEEYHGGKEPKNAISLQAVENMGERVYFKASVRDREGRILCFYAMDRGESYINNYMGVTYNGDIVGTPLEKKLLKELDYAVSSYRETVTEE